LTNVKEKRESMKWLKEIEERELKAIEKARKNKLREIYLYLEKTLTQEEFDFLKEYGSRKPINAVLTDLKNLDDYGKIDLILAQINESINNVEKRRFFNGILAKLGFKKCLKCGKYFDSEKKTQFCLSCRKDKNLEGLKPISFKP